MGMPKRRNLTDMEFDEISLVDKGANQHAMVTIAKRATEEEEMPELYSEDGTLVDENALQDGDIVYDEEGNAYQFEAEAEVEEEESELAGVGKSAFFQQQEAPQTGSFAAELREELSKAFSDDDKDEVIAKAFGRIDELEGRFTQAEQVAKSERDLRLSREYVSKAAEYNVPVDPTELGPVLYRMAETMDYDDCAVIAKCLEASGALFEELGFQGGGDNDDVYSQVEQAANERIGKAAAPSDVADIFDENPSAYDEYLASQRGRF